MKIDTFKVNINIFKIKIEKCPENEKNAQVVTRANWTDPNWQSHYDVSRLAVIHKKVYSLLFTQYIPFDFLPFLGDQMGQYIKEKK